VIACQEFAEAIAGVSEERTPAVSQERKEGGAVLGSWDHVGDRFGGHQGNRPGGVGTRSL
jgi:hypothetical protein